MKKEEKEMNTCTNSYPHSEHAKHILRFIGLIVFVILFSGIIACTHLKLRGYNTSPHTNSNCSQQTLPMMHHETNLKEYYQKTPVTTNRAVAPQMYMKEAYFAPYAEKTFISDVQQELFREALKSELQERMGEKYEEKAKLLVDALIELEETSMEQKEAFIKMKEAIQTAP